MQPNAAPQVYRHDVFISYSRKNEAFASSLERALESYKPPKDLKAPQRYLEVFRDKEDFTAGEYHQNLDKHLRESSKLIVICSPAARKSQYVNDEIRRFAQARGADHIIPILFSGIPNNEARPGQEEEMAFPEALCEVMEMPLAVNYIGWDEEKEKINKGVFSDAWHTTLANIYEVSRSEIEQREKKRRARARRITYGVLSGSVAVLSVLLVFALVSRGQAVAARTEAENQRGEAVAARDVAEKERRRAESQEQVASEERDKAVAARQETEEALKRETAAKDEAEERRKEAERERKVAEEQRGIAERQTLIAEERARLATARQLAAQAMAASEQTVATTAFGTVGPERSVLLALESLERLPTTEGTKSLRDAITRLSGRTPEVKFKADDNVADFALSPDGNSLAVIHNGKAYLRSVGVRQGDDWQIPAESPRSIIFSPDGKRLAVLGDDSTSVWDLAARSRLYTLPALKDANEVVLNFDGSQLISLSGTALQVWGVQSSSVVRQIKPPPGGWIKAALSPGGRWLAGLNNTGVVRVTDVTTGREVSRFRSRAADGLAVSQDGELLAVINGTEVVVWRVQGWRKVASLPHEWQVQEMSFSWNGRWLTTVTGKVSMDAAEMDSTSFPGSAIRVWDLKTQRLVTHASLAQEGGFAQSGAGRAVAFTANGDRLVTASDIVKPSPDGEGSIQSEGFKLVAWILLPADLNRTACSLLRRNLSRSEWSTFMGGEPYRQTCKGLPVPDE